MRYLRSVFALILSTLMLLGGSTLTAFAADIPPELTILFTHDTHDHFLPAREEGGGEYGGYVRLATLLKEERAAAARQGRTVVTLDGGDFSMGALFQTIYTTDAPELRALGAMGYDVTTLGNHEFDYRQQGLADMLNAAKGSGDPLPEIVQANYTQPLEHDSGYAVVQALENYPVTDYTIVERDGLRVAVFGVLGQDAHDYAPMSGMADFSLIPAFLTDRAELVHGSSSLRYAAGGIGGAVILGTGPDLKEGLSMQFIQGIGSFLTVDDYLRIGYRHKGFHASLRTVFSFSPGRFPYVNMDKKVNEYDDDMNIISSYHPREYNENGKYRDWHVLLETGYDIPAGGDIRLAVWRLGSYRQLPKLTVDYSGSGDFINEQDENTLRAVATYSKRAGDVNICASAGYELSGVSYDYAFDAGNGNWSSIH